MTVLFRNMSAIFVIVCHLLVLASTASQSERKKTNRHLRTTAAAEPFPSSTTFERTTIATTIWTETSPSVALHELPSVDQNAESRDVDWYQAYNHKIKKNPNTRKPRKNGFNGESELLINNSQIRRNKTRIFQNTVTDRIRQQPVEVVTSGKRSQQNTAVVKYVTTVWNGGNTGVYGRQRSPRVKVTPSVTELTRPIAGLPPSLKKQTYSTLGNLTLPTTKLPETKYLSNKSGSKLGGSANDDLIITTSCNGSCDMSECTQVEAENCKGRVIKDPCNCCPVCLVDSIAISNSTTKIITKKPSYYPTNACDGMICAKNKVCILNIQGIPMCRCPNIYGCRNAERSPLCAQNGVTYKNKCFLKVEECTEGRRIRVVHKGACRNVPSTTTYASAKTSKPTLSQMPLTNFQTYSYVRTQENGKRKAGKRSKYSGYRLEGSAAKRETKVNAGVPIHRKQSIINKPSPIHRQQSIIKKPSQSSHQSRQSAVRFRE